MSGTAVKTSFIKKFLIPCIKTNVKSYVEQKWTEKEATKDVERFKAQSQKDESAPRILGTDADLAEQQQSVVDYVLFCLDNKKESRALSLFKFDIWFDGYDNNQIQTPVYSGVCHSNKEMKVRSRHQVVCREQWMGRCDQKVYVKHKSALNLQIDNHFDTSLGQLTDKENHQKILAKIGEQPEGVKSHKICRRGQSSKRDTNHTYSGCDSSQKDSKVGRIRQTNDKNSMIQ